MLSWTRNLFRGKRAVELPPDGIEPVVSREPPRVGALLGDRYRLESLIGRGGSSVVYRASDVALGAEIAVKVLCGERERSEGGDWAARAEATAAMRLSHPNIARVYGYARHDPWRFVVMEYLAGEDLHSLAKKKPGRRLQLADLLRVSVRSLDALAHAHASGVVHDDVKPSNIILTRAGALKLCDFGLSHVAGDSTDPWLRAASAGSHAFMSPERILDEPSDERSDLYSLAATLYTLGTGHTLFGTELAQAWRGHLELHPPTTRYLPRPIFRVLEVALSKDPDKRFRSASEMREALLDAFRALRPPETSRAPSRRSKAPPPRPSPSRSRAEEPEVPEAPPDDGAARAQIRLVPPPGMVWIEPCLLDSRHGGKHEVGGFWLMRAPVTNEEYQRFVDETGAVPPAHWIGGAPPRQKERHPVVGVSLESALAYSRWAGLRLPSDIEWEAAARGPAGRAFPWGESFEAKRVNGLEQGRADTMPVDAHPDGRSEAGCLDLVGNAWEWTDPERCVRAPEPGYAWVFGGSFRHPCEQDGGIPRTQVAGGKEYLYLGFRCALDDRRAP